MGVLALAASWRCPSGYSLKPGAAADRSTKSPDADGRVGRLHRSRLCSAPAVVVELAEQRLPPAESVLSAYSAGTNMPPPPPAVLKEMPLPRLLLREAIQTLRPHWNSRQERRCDFAYRNPANRPSRRVFPLPVLVLSGPPVSRQPAFGLPFTACTLLGLKRNYGARAQLPWVQESAAANGPFLPRDRLPSLPRSARSPTPRYSRRFG
jgi:hypothetical protein